MQSHVDRDGNGTSGEASEEGIEQIRPIPLHKCHAGSRTYTKGLQSPGQSTDPLSQLSIGELLLTILDCQPVTMKPTGFRQEGTNVHNNISPLRDRVNRRWAFRARLNDTSAHLPLGINAGAIISFLAQEALSGPRKTMNPCPVSTCFARWASSSSALPCPHRTSVPEKWRGSHPRAFPRLLMSSWPMLSASMDCISEGRRRARGGSLSFRKPTRSN